MVDAENTIYVSTKNSALKAPEEMDVSPIEREGVCFLAANGVQCVIETNRLLSVLHVANGMSVRRCSVDRECTARRWNGSSGVPDAG